LTPADTSATAPSPPPATAAIAQPRKSPSGRCKSLNQNGYGDYAYFHMMWTLTDSLESYKSEGLTKSLDKTIRQDIYKNYFSRMEGKSYWVEVIKMGDKYYLVVALN
jgi:hypothetical protein